MLFYGLTVILLCSGRERGECFDGAAIEVGVDVLTALCGNGGELVPYTSPLLYLNRSEWAGDESAGEPANRAPEHVRVSWASAGAFCLTPSCRATTCPTRPCPIAAAAAGSCHGPAHTPLSRAQGCNQGNTCLLLKS